VYSRRGLTRACAAPTIPGNVVAHRPRRRVPQGVGVGVSSSGRSHHRCRLLQPEAHAHLAVHRRRRSEVRLGLRSITSPAGVPPARGGNADACRARRRMPGLGSSDRHLCDVEPLTGAATSPMRRRASARGRACHVPGRGSGPRRCGVRLLEAICEQTSLAQMCHGERMEECHPCGLAAEAPMPGSGRPRPNSSLAPQDPDASI
jgi:hypothetical protein